MNKLNLTTSRGLSALFNFYRANKVPLGELEKLENDFEETGSFNGKPIWTPRVGKTEEEIRYFNEALMDWVWHFRDFFWAYAVKNLGMTEKAAQALTKATVAQSDALKLCGYFTNLRKHVELKDFGAYPAFKTNPPRLGGVWFHFLMENGNTTIATDLIGAEAHQISRRFPFIQTVEIENFPDHRDTRRVAEEGSWEWIELLKAQGVDLDVEQPLWVECKPPDIDFLGMGTSPKAIAAMTIQLPPGWVGVTYRWDELLMQNVRIIGMLNAPQF